MLCEGIREQVERRHGHALALKEHAREDVVDARAYVEAMLGPQAWAHTVYPQAMADPHSHPGGHEHD